MHAQQVSFGEDLWYYIASILGLSHFNIIYCCSWLFLLASLAVVGWGAVVRHTSSCRTLTTIIFGSGPISQGVIAIIGLSRWLSNVSRGTVHFAISFSLLDLKHPQCFDCEAQLIAVVVQTAFRASHYRQRLAWRNVWFIWISRLLCGWTLPKSSWSAAL